MDRQNLAVYVLFGKGVNMVLAPYSSGNETRQAKHGIDGCHETNNDGIIVIRGAVGKLVGWMVDETEKETK